ERLLIAGLIQKADHQHLSGLRVLHNAGHKPAFDFGEVDLDFCQFFIAHRSSIFSCCWVNVKSPPELVRRRASGFSDSRPLTQATQIRRHVHRMMMVVLTMMEVNLHLQQKYMARKRMSTESLLH